MEALTTQASVAIRLHGIGGASSRFNKVRVMLDVSSIRGAAMMLALVVIVGSRLLELKH